MDKHNFKEFFGTKGIRVQEAELANGIHDYQGGVVFKLRDPSTYVNMKADVESFVKKKGMQIIKNKFDAQRGVGYMHFSDSGDTSKDAQRIQGFISQLPEVEKFKFAVIGAKKKPSKMSKQINSNPKIQRR